MGPSTFEVYCILLWFLLSIIIQPLIERKQKKREVSRENNRKKEEERSNVDHGEKKKKQKKHVTFATDLIHIRELPQRREENRLNTEHYKKVDSIREKREREVMFYELIGLWPEEVPESEYGTIFNDSSKVLPLTPHQKLILTSVLHSSKEDCGQGEPTTNNDANTSFNITTSSSTPATTENESINTSSSTAPQKPISTISQGTTSTTQSQSTSTLTSAKPSFKAESFQGAPNQPNDVYLSFKTSTIISTSPTTSISNNNNGEMEKRTKLGIVKQYNEVVESKDVYDFLKNSVKVAPKKPTTKQNTPTNEIYQSFQKSIKGPPKKIFSPSSSTCKSILDNVEMKTSGKGIFHINSKDDVIQRNGCNHSPKKSIKVVPKDSTTRYELKSQEVKNEMALPSNHDIDIEEPPNSESEIKQQTVKGKPKKQKKQPPKKEPNKTLRRSKRLAEKRKKKPPPRRSARLAAKNKKG